MKGVDFGKTAADYAKHRAGFPDRFFERLAGLGIGRRGQSVLDLGTGTGTVARGLAKRGCTVTGLDPSSAMVETARALDRDAGVTVDYVVATAEATGMPDASFEVVTAGQCWHWFDRAAAAREARRVLVPGGALVIAHFDWLPLPGSVVEATERLIREHNPGWTLGSLPSAGTGIYPPWLLDASGAGFTSLETFSFDVAAPYSHDSWRGRIRASAGVAASLAPDAVERFDAAHAAMLRAGFPDPLVAPHRVWALVGRAP